MNAFLIGVVLLTADAGETLAVEKPTAIAVDKSDLMVTSNDALFVFARHGLALTGKYRHEKLQSPTAIVVNGEFIYVIGNTLLVYRKRETLELVQTLSEEQASTIRRAGVSPDGMYLYVTDLSSRRVSVYEVRSDGKLIRVQSITLARLNRPTALAVGRDHVYVCCASNNAGQYSAICVFARKGNGELTYVGAEVDQWNYGQPPRDDRGLCHPVAVALEDNRLYVASAAGRLSFWQADGDKLEHIKWWGDNEEGFEGLDRAMAIGIARGRVWVASLNDGVAWFRCKNEQGLLSYGGKVDLEQASILAISPDGHVYAGGKAGLRVIKPDEVQPPNDQRQKKPLQENVTVVANTSQIRQHDHLLVRGTVHGECVLTGYPRIKYQVRIGKQDWQPAPTMVEIRDLCVGAGKLSVKLNSTYAEYGVIHLRRLVDVRNPQAKKDYIFDRPDKVLLRAIAATLDGDVISRPIEIDVIERSAADLTTIENAGEWLYWLGREHLEPGQIPPDLDRLESVEGNIALRVKHLRLVQKGINEARLEDWRRKMDPVSLERSLILLGRHFAKIGDFERLQPVVQQLPDCRERRQWIHCLEQQGIRVTIPLRID